MRRRLCYILCAALWASAAGCDNRAAPDLADLPGQGGTAFESGTSGNADDPYAANPNASATDGNTIGDSNAPAVTGGGSTTGHTTAAGTTGASTTATTTGAATTGGATTASPTGSTAGASTTGGATTASTTSVSSGNTTAASTTGGTGTTGGGSPTEGTTTQAAPPAIAATTGGPGSSSYNSSATSYINGNVEGVNIQVTSAVFCNSSSSGQPTLVVILSDQTNLCAALTAGQAPKNSHQVRLVFYAGSASWPPNGNYDADGSQVSATFAFYDGSGTQTLAAAHASLHAGNVQLNDYAHGPGGDAQGNAQGLVGNQSDGMSVGFNASYCAAVR